METNEQVASIDEQAAVEAQSAPERQDTRNYTVAPELIYNRESIAPLWLSEYKLWFVNRREFYVQNLFATPADYDSKQSPSWSRVKVLLSEEQVVRHLCGIQTIGLYTIDPDSNACKWFCLDADYDGSEEHLKAIEEEMRLDGLTPAYENSRRGGHLWLLCDEPISAKVGRIYLYNLLDRLGYAVRGPRGNKEGVEVFPKQESLDAGQFGNGIRGPLGIHRKVKERFWFRDAAPDLQSQFHYLRTLRRVTREKLEALTDGMDMPEDLLPKPFVPLTNMDPASAFSEFDIRQFTPPPRGNRAKYMTRCPGCASAGKDTSGDNLSVSTSKKPSKRMLGIPDFYCHAGCTFKDITHACGWRYVPPERVLQPQRFGSKRNSR
jgi:hypothetical protein